MLPDNNPNDNLVLPPTDEQIYNFFNYIFNDLKGEIGTTWETYIPVVNYFLNNENTVMTNNFLSFSLKNEHINFNEKFLIESKKYAFEKDYIYEDNIEKENPIQRPIQFKFCLYLWMYIHH